MQVGIERQHICLQLWSTDVFPPNLNTAAVPRCLRCWCSEAPAGPSSPQSRGVRQLANSFCLAVYSPLKMHISFVCIDIFAYIYIHKNILYIYIHTYMYIYIHTHIYIRIYTYPHVYLNIYTCVDILIYVGICLYVYIYIYTYEYIYIHHIDIYNTYTHIHMYTCTHIHIYTYTQTHT